MASLPRKPPRAPSASPSSTPPPSSTRPSASFATSASVVPPSITSSPTTPPILAANVDKTLEPKLASLRSVGFSDADITDLVASNSALLHLNFLPKIKLLDAYLPSKADLLKTLRREPILLRTNLTSSLVPNVALLCSHGVVEHDITHALISLPRLLTQKTAYFKKLFNHVVGLGFPHGRITFLQALHALSRLSKETYQSKVNMMKSS